MRLIKMLTGMLLVVLFGVVGAGFYSANDGVVPLDLFVVPMLDVSIGMLVLSTLLIGFLLGALLTTVPLMTAKLARDRAKRSLAKAQVELQELRMSPIKGSDSIG